MVRNKNHFLQHERKLIKYIFTIFLTSPQFFFYMILDHDSNGYTQVLEISGISSKFYIRVSFKAYFKVQLTHHPYQRECLTFVNLVLWYPFDHIYGKIVNSQIARKAKLYTSNFISEIFFYFLNNHWLSREKTIFIVWYRYAEH